MNPADIYDKLESEDVSARFEQIQAFVTSGFMYLTHERPSNGFSP